MRSRRAAAMLASVLVLGWSSGASGAEPDSASIGPDTPSAEWTGERFEAGDIADPATCAADADPEHERCDHFLLTVEVDEAYWESHDGGVSVSIEWLEPRDDFDLYVFDASGELVASAETGASIAQEVFLEQPAGTYEVRVVPVSVTASAYTGTVSFSSEAVAPPDETEEDVTPPPPDDGSDGGGGDEEADPDADDEADEGDDELSGRDGGAGDRSGAGGATQRRSAPAASGSGVRSTSPSSNPELLATQPSFEMRPFDTRAFGALLGDGSPASTGGVPSGLVRSEPNSGRAAIAPAPGEVEGAPGAPIAATEARLPRSAGLVVGLGVVALVLTAIAVFDRLPPANEPPVGSSRWRSRRDRIARR